MIRIAFYIFLFLILVASIFVIIFWWQIRTPLNISGEKVIFKVEKGDSAKTIADNLVKSGLIDKPFIFRLYAYFSLSQTALKSGEYELSSKMSIRDIADSIILGGTNEVLITIPEGFTLKQIEDRLVAADLIKTGELSNFKFANGPEILSSKPKSASLEGYLFPDTYRFFKDASLSDIASKMVKNFDDKITPDLKAKILIRSDYNLHQIITMASLIEKEVKSDNDRAIVSGILWKRLRAGIPLQVDATLVYITGRREIYEADKKINSAYNTYYYRGLPKGPISNPGLSAIRAAVYPQNSSYLYYLSAKDGRTIFSKNLEEHNQNRTKYLK